MQLWKSYVMRFNELQRQEPRLIAGTRLVIDHQDKVLHSTDQSLGRNNRRVKASTRGDTNIGDELIAPTGAAGTAIREDPEYHRETVRCKVATPHRYRRATGAGIGRYGHIGLNSKGGACRFSTGFTDSDYAIVLKTNHCRAGHHKTGSKSPFEGGMDNDNLASLEENLHVLATAETAAFQIDRSPDHTLCRTV